MPEGMTSIDDLKVVITANSEQLSQGLTNAGELLSRFTADSDAKLSRFDALMARTGASVLSVRNNIAIWTEGMTAALSVLETMNEKLETAAKIAGAEEEYNTFVEAMKSVYSALNDVRSGADSSTQSAAYLKREVSDLSLELNAAGVSAGDAMKAGLAKLTEQLERAAHEARRFTSKDTWQVHTIDAEIRRTEEYIDAFKRRIESINSNGVNFVERLLGINNDNAIEKLRSQISQYEAELDRLGELRVRAQWKTLDVDDQSPKLLQSLDREIEGLRIRAATLGMGAAEAAAYTAAERIRQEAEAKGISLGDAFNEHMQQRLALMRRYRQQIENYVAAERAQRDQEREAARQEKGRESLVDNLERELSALRSKQRALGDVSAATKAQEVEERLLQQARQRNIEVTDELRIQIKAYASEIGRADEAMREHQRVLAQVQQGVGVVFRGVETIINRSLDGAQLKMRDVVASMLNDLSALILKMMVLKPLQESMAGGITGLIGGAGSGIGSLFSGFFANGGEVTAGRAHIVGERGPELFIPTQSGDIVPNSALRRGGSGSAGTVHVTIANTIDARGAYPESIADIKKALAEQQQALPGRVMEVVGDARERGGL